MTGDVLDVLNSWPAEKRQQALMAIEEVENEVRISCCSAA